MKKALNSTLLTILITSMFSAALVALVTPAYSATVGTLEVSTTRFWGNATVQVRLYDPDLNINASERDFATLSVTINSYNGSTYGPIAVYANESLPNSGEFYFYFANASATIDSATVRSPPYGNEYYNKTWGLEKYDQVVITYNDQSPVGSVSVTVTYKPYVATAADISFDRTSLEYPMNGYIRTYIKDLDYNLDPTSKDSVLLNITFVAPTVGISNSTVYNFTETGSNTGVFMNTTSYFTSSPFNATYFLNFTGAVSGTPVQVIYANETTEPYQYITLKYYTPTLNVDSTFTTAGNLTITVVDPNLNQKSWWAENIGEDYNETVCQNTTVMVKVSGTQADNETLAEEFDEDDVNAGTFTYTLPVTIGNPNGNDGVLQLKTSDLRVNIYYIVNGTLKASTVSTWSKQAASLTIDKTQYKNTDEVTMTLTAPDLNTESASINFITRQVSSSAFLNYTTVYFTMDDQVVGNLTVKVNGLTAKAGSKNITLTFIETGVNTGVFTAKLDLSNVKRNDGTDLADGDSIAITYYDAINNVYSTATGTIGVAAATISLDRSTYPVPKNGNVIMYITVTDSTKNTASTTIDTANAYMDVYYYNGTRATSDNVTLTETGPNTGVFKGARALMQSSDVLYINGWVKALYLDPATSKNITVTAMLMATDAAISVDKATVKAGDTFTITVNDPDGNFNPDTKEKVSVDYEYTDLAGNLVKSPTAGTPWSLSETGSNTGVFTYSLTVGLSIKVKPGTTIKLTYSDDTPSYITAATGYPTTPVKYTVTIKVASFTGVLSTDKTEYGIGSKMIITVNDSDLNTDIASKENVNVTLRIAGVPGDISIMLTEMNVSSSIFKNDTYKLPVDIDYIGKTFQIYYKDEADANGNMVIAIVTGTIKSWDGLVQFDKAYYNIGDMAVVTITDPDQNQDPGKVETITVTVTSDSDPLGSTITATETDFNTGIFQARIQVSNIIETGKVYAKVGDTLYAKYVDAYPADYPTTEKSKTFTGTAVVGVPVARPVPASDQKFVDPNTGAEKTSGKVGEAIMLQATVKNVDAVSKPFTAIFKVKDSSGATIFISWVSGTLTSGQSLTPAVSWTPSAAGTYTVEVLVIKSISEPTPYSDKLSMELPVT